jgi:hypothetical protein
MPSILSVLILGVTLLATFVVSRNLWVQTTHSPTDLREHVTLLALGYTVFIGGALQGLVRAFKSYHTELRPVTILRLLGTLAATVGYVYGIVWAFNSGKYHELLKPVAATDLIVIGSAWLLSVKAFKATPSGYWDFALGLAALFSWYLATAAWLRHT